MIPNGASLLIGGFMGVGSPLRVIDEIVRQGKRDYAGHCQRHRYARGRDWQAKGARLVQ